MTIHPRLRRWEMRISINYSYLSLANVMIVICIGCHWVACTWGLQASFAPLRSWYSMVIGSDDELAYCAPWAEGLTEAGALEMLTAPADKDGACPSGRQCSIGDCDTGICTGGSSCASPYELYTVSSHGVEHSGGWAADSHRASSVYYTPHPMLLTSYLSDATSRFFALPPFPNGTDVTLLCNQLRLGCRDNDCQAMYVAGDGRGIEVAATAQRVSAAA